MPSNHTTIGAYSLEHKDRCDVTIGEERYIFVLQSLLIGTSHRAMYSVHACISHYVLLL